MRSFHLLSVNFYQFRGETGGAPHMVGLLSFLSMSQRKPQIDSDLSKTS